MLSLHSISQSVSNKLIFENINITFMPSSIIYLTGKNGSGKTSLLRMIAGIQKPSYGKITYGKSANPLSYYNKPYCTYIGHKLGLKYELSVIENIEFWAKSYDAMELVGAALTYLQLEDIAEKKCYELSAGNQKKVALAKLIICQSKLWLLDEIETNLDSKNKELLMNLITTHANNGGIIFISSHMRPEVQKPIILNLEDYRKNQL